MKQAAHNEWNNYLSRIEVTGTDDEKTNFYTSFYHALIQPNQISDVDGWYRNAADSIVKAGNGAFIPLSPYGTLIAPPTRLHLNGS